MSEIHVRLAHWQKDNADLRRIREAVFIAEQAVPAELEWDDEDIEAVHLLACEGDYPIGTARLLAARSGERRTVIPDGMELAPAGNAAITRLG